MDKRVREAYIPGARYCNKRDKLTGGKLCVGGQFSDISQNLEIVDFL